LKSINDIVASADKQEKKQEKKKEENMSEVA